MRKRAGKPDADAGMDGGGGGGGRGGQRVLTLATYQIFNCNKLRVSLGALEKKTKQNPKTAFLLLFVGKQQVNHRGAAQLLNRKPASD